MPRHSLNKNDVTDQRMVVVGPKISVNRFTTNGVSKACSYCVLKFVFLCALKPYNKSELMLMSRARAYISSCSQVVLVYLHPFRRNSFFCSRKSPKITKNLILRIQGYLRSSMLMPLKGTSLLLVMVSSMSVPICNHFHAR